MMVKRGVNGLGVSVPNSVAFGPAGTVYDSALDLWSYFNTPPITAPPSPAYGAPIAPQTQSAMVSWTPDQQAEAYAQKGNQYTADTSYFGSLLQGKSPTGTNTPTVSNDAPVPGKDNTLTWVLLAVAGVLLLVAMKGK